MRVIIEAESQEEIERLRALLESDVLKDAAVTVRRPPSPDERRAILQQICDRYRVKLPKGWKFDRDEAHER